MDTREAFEKLIEERGLGSRLGKPKNYITNLRAAHKKGKVRLDKMEELLKEAGWKKVVVEEWETF